MTEPQVSPAGRIAISPLLFFRDRFDARDGNRTAIVIDCHKGEIRRICVLAFPRQEIFPGDPDPDFDRRVEGPIHRCLQRDNLPDSDRMMKMELIHGRRHAHPVRVPGGRDGGRDIDHMHQTSAKEVSQPVCIVGKDHFGHFDF